MGTLFALTVYAPDAATAGAAQAKAFARVAELEKVLSDYDPRSEVLTVCRANDDAPGKPIAVSADLAAALKLSLDLSDRTDGAFDVTLGPLTKLWRQTRRTQRLPAPEELAAAKALCGYKLLTLDADKRTLTFAKPGVRLDFGGIGKGFAADEVLKLLKAGGIDRALVAASGDITCGAPPPGEKGWKVDVKPLAAGRPPRRLVLANASVSTSGDLDQVAVVDGVRYSHLLDPGTGLGLPGRRSVTVVAPTGALADALTKPASVWPREKALAFIEAEPGAALWMTVKLGDAAAEVATESARLAGYLAD